MQSSCYRLQEAPDKTVIKRLQQDLSAHETQVGNLTRNLEQVAVDVDLKSKILVPYFR